MKNFYNYTKGLLYYQAKGTCLDMSENLENVTHDSLTRFLKKNWSGQKRLATLFSEIKMKEGYLIIDDTVSAKPDATAMEKLQSVYDTKLGKPVLGYVTVLLVWTDGNKKIPIGIRFWIPGEKTKIELALELLSYARNCLKLKPKCVLFDSWYAAKPILKRLQNYGWCFVTRIKENRLFNGQPLNLIGWRNHWQGIGVLHGGIKVHIIKNGDRFLATNRILLDRDAIVSFYSIRPIIEEVFRILKQELCFASCQMRSILAQEHHQWCSLFAFFILEIKRIHLHISIYKLHKQLCRRGSTLSLSIFERISFAA